MKHWLLMEWLQPFRSVSSTISDGTYKINDVIPITITFSEAVTVTGTLQLTLETGTNDAVVNYATGSGGSILTFITPFHQAMLPVIWTMFQLLLLP